MRPFISSRIASIPESGLTRFFDVLATMDDVLSLGIGEPDLPTPQAIKDAGANAIYQGHTGYTSNAGILELREHIATYVQEQYGVSYDPETEILVTVGVSEGLHAAMLSLVESGDEVLMPEPCFVSYDPCIRFADATPVPVPTLAEENFELRLGALEARFTTRSRVLLISYPNNPTGAVMDRKGMLMVAEFAQKHDLIVISDEIYDRFLYGVDHVCMPALPGMRERTLLLGGFSKCYAMTGWRLGYACGPRELITAMNKVHQYIIMSAPTIAQIGVLGGMMADDDLSQNIIQEFARRREVLLQGLTDIGLPCVEPRGAIYAFPSIAHTGLDSMTFAERLLLEEKLAVVPGHVFGDSGQGHIRIAYTVSCSELEEALTRLDRFVKKLG